MVAILRVAAGLLSLWLATYGGLVLLESAREWQASPVLSVLGAMMLPGLAIGFLGTVALAAFGLATLADRRNGGSNAARSWLLTTPVTIVMLADASPWLVEPRDVPLDCVLLVGLVVTTLVNVAAWWAMVVYRPAG